MIVLDNAKMGGKGMNTPGDSLRKEQFWKMAVKGKKSGGKGD